MKKKKEVNQFKHYKQTLSEQENETLKEYFLELDQHMALSRKVKAQMRTDFEKAFLYYSSIGISLDNAIKRLSIQNLGGFYVRPPIMWYALDDAAKIYPLSIKHDQMAVFRLSVYLKEKVVPELLQIALTFTVKRFPSFATTVKKGFFWHYLDTAKRRFKVEPETDIPCKPLDISLSGSQSFRVLYYNNRISVEYFHILTDGTGGMLFLKTLTAEYLRLLGANIPFADGILNINDTPSREEMANEFPRAEKTEKSGFIDKSAVQMSGKLSKIKPCRIIHFKLNASKLKKTTKEYNATVTAYIIALMFIAGKSATDEIEGSINIQVPVNMRKFYPSKTVRNFSMYCGIRLPLTEITDTESIIPEITRQLNVKASKSAMNKMMNATNGLVNILRYIPLFIKAPVAHIVYGFLGDKIFSNTLSNLGVVKLPSEMARYIESMDFVLGTGITNRASCAMVTFGNTATLSISKLTADPSFEEKMYQLFQADGLEPALEGSELYEG